jgi:hypothetical protein
MTKRWLKARPTCAFSLGVRRPLFPATPFHEIIPNGILILDADTSQITDVNLFLVNVLGY